MKSISGVLTLLLAVLGFAVTQAAPVSAAAKPLPAICTTSGPISARSAPAKISLRSCPIQGRLLVLKLSNGKLGPGLHIPGPGQGTGGSELTTHGEYDLSAVNVRGWVTIRWSVPAKPAHAATPAATDPACSENAYNWEGPFWANTGTPTDAWYYNESTASRAGLTVSATESDIRQANTNLTRGINNCGWSEGAFGVRGAFQGNTSKYANINSASACTSNFPDGQNTVSWGSFDSNHSGALAYTCYNWHTDANGYPVMTEADTYLGSNRNIVDTFPANCSNRYDLQSVMTHEWGHAYGMAHESSGGDEVMYPYESPCHLRRHLGGGDYSGMAGLYP